MRQIATILLVAASVLGLAIPTQPSNLSVNGTGQNVQEINRQLRHYDLVTLDAANIADQVRRTGQLSLSTSERTFELSLSPNDIRAVNYRAEEVTGDGTVRSLEGLAAMIYKGTVRGMDGAQARFTIDGNVVEGLIITRTQKYFIEPASRYAFSASRTDYVIYKESDVIQNFIETCPVTLSEEVRSEMGRISSSASGIPQEFAGATNNAVTPLREVEIATEADNQFVQALGSAPAANNEILSILNMVDGVYQNEIGLTFRVVFQRAWSAQDPYDPTTSAAALLPDLRTKYDGTFAPGSPPARDVVHMWTGRAMDAAGYAFGGGINHGVNTQGDGVVCRDAQFGASAAYGVSQRFINAVAKVVVPAHEIGHNFGASHPDQEISNPPGCGTTIMNSNATNSTLTFCQFSRDQITNYINGSGNGIDPNDSCLAIATNPPPTVQFSSNSYQGTEGTDKSVTITVTRSSGTGISTVFYETVNQSASERSDFTTARGTLSFAAGVLSKTFSVFITDDVYAEPAQTFGVLLSSPTGATLGTPSSATVTIFDNDPTNGANPVKNASFNAGFFVRQHYIDFFTREPDPSGLAYWTNEITQCGSNQQCLDIKRINVSAAFFISIEFKETGYLVYRTYKAAYGDAVGTSTDGGTHQVSVPVIRFYEFLPDTQQIGRGVEVGIGNWQTVLENNKQAFMEEFVLRPRFTSAYPQSMTPSQFVDTLNANAAGVLSPAERDQLVNDLTNGVKTRGQVLRAVAEDPDLFNLETNRAFVLMQYFGYLRRNPDDLPDSNHTGYDFWLKKLILFNGNFVNAQMVNAFITSTEYQQRFGP